MGERRAGWRWANVPIPEPYVGGLLVGTVLHLLWPARLDADRRRTRTAGLLSLSVGLLAVGWSVRAFGEQESRDPNALVTTGPYAFSRNPMYVGWTALYLGVALVLNTVWLLVLLPAVSAAVHSTVRREERALERAFGDEYRDYRREVRRYV